LRFRNRDPSVPSVLHFSLCIFHFAFASSMKAETHLRTADSSRGNRWLLALAIAAQAIWLALLVVMVILR
jgi:hypothetical protein